MKHRSDEYHIKEYTVEVDKLKDGHFVDVAVLKLLLCPRHLELCETKCKLNKCKMIMRMRSEINVEYLNYYWGTDAKKRCS